VTDQPLSPDELILRDRLALDRTHLANERTLLAYARTAFMLLAAGATAIKALPEDRWAVVAGWTLLGLGAVMTSFGVRRFIVVRRRIVAESR
jgi:putative membrane protein